jgi:dTMP kinase
MFITFEGIDGSGKSTQLKLLARELENAGHKVKVLREPGSTPFSEKIREILLSNRFDIAPLTELLLFEASRSHLVQNEILPALKNNEIVICDRFYDSTTAYQGYGRGLNLDDVRRMNAIATGGLQPDITFFLDVSVFTSYFRTKDIASDRIEAAGDEFFNRVRSGFLKIAEQEPDRVIVINSESKIEDTHRKIMSIIRKKFPHLIK